MHGKRAITAPTALCLSRALGVDGRFWTNFQTHYDLGVDDRFWINFQTDDDLEVERDLHGDEIDRMTQLAAS